MTQTEYNHNKLIQVVLFVLNETRGIDYYHLFKILYFADLKHLSVWGNRLLPDQFFALNYGPVPTQLYDLVKHCSTIQDKNLQKQFDDAVRRGEDDASSFLFAKVCTDMDYLSTAEIESLRSSIQENASLTFSQLLEKSHDEIWRKWYEKGKKVIPTLDMAKSANVSADMLEYIKEQQELDEVLS